MRASACPFHSIRSIREFDALDPHTREDPWPFYDWLRDDNQRRVYKLPHEENYYAVHRYEDVKQLFADTENFSNSIIPTAKSPFLALMDAPGHTRIRNAVSLLFSPKNLAAWEPRIQAVIDTATRHLISGKPVELFDTWAHPIPLGTLAALFGLPGDATSIKKLHHHAIAINRALFVTGGTGPRRNPQPTFPEKLRIGWSLLAALPRFIRLRKLIGNRGIRELRDMIRITNRNLEVPRPHFEHIPAAVIPLMELMLAFAERLCDEPGSERNESLRILREPVGSGEVTLTEMMMAGAFILFAGYETTASLLSNCLVHLERNPKMFRNLKDDPSRIDDFIEEALRYYTPVGRFLRRALRDVSLHGVTIPKNAIVILMPGAANTDPMKFENGCGFNPDRANNRQHLSFGKGAHFCIGAPLARMQVSMALRSLLLHAGTLTVDATKPLKMVTDRDNGILRYEEVWIQVEGKYPE